MIDHFSTPEPGDFIELPAGYVVPVLRHPLVRWETQPGSSHTAYLGDIEIATIFGDETAEDETAMFHLNNCILPGRYHYQSYHADNVEKAKSLLETIVKEWVTAAGLMAARSTVYYTKPTEDEVAA